MKKFFFNLKLGYFLLTQTPQNSSLVKRNYLTTFFKKSVFCLLCNTVLQKCGYTTGCPRAKCFFFLIWLWEKEIYKLDYNWRYFKNPEMWKFWLLEPIFKKKTSSGLNNLKQKICKNCKWYFIIPLKIMVFKTSK